MKRVLMLAVLCFALTGCSLLPRITFDKAGVTPTSTTKSSNVTKCAGEVKYDAEGNVVSCTKGYYNNEQNFKQDERKYTLQERIANFIRGLAGWGFWIFIALVFLCPSVAGWILSELFGGAKRALTTTRDTLVATVRGIQKAKNNGVKLSPEDKVKYEELVTEMMSSISAEHKADPEMVKLIDAIRTDLKIEENL